MKELTNTGILYNFGNCKPGIQLIDWRCVCLQLCFMVSREWSMHARLWAPSTNKN